jgi:hypothetical protein
MQVPGMRADAHVYTLDDVTGITRGRRAVGASLLPHLLPDIVNGDNDAKSLTPMPDLQFIGFSGCPLCPKFYTLLEDTLLRRHASGGSHVSLVLVNG